MQLMIMLSIDVFIGKITIYNDHFRNADFMYKNKSLLGRSSASILWKKEGIETMEIFHECVNVNIFSFC